MKLKDYSHYTEITYYVNIEAGYFRRRKYLLSSIGDLTDAEILHHIKNKHDIEDVSNVIKWSFMHGVADGGRVIKRYTL